MKIETGEFINCDLRSIWPNEERDFTPWLSQDGLSRLSAAVGIDLKFIEREHKVGNYELDILAENFNTNERVIIENQLENSDHDHLGKCITYWGSTNAKYIIWVFKKLRDEHKRAIERLNSILSDELRIFAVEVNVFRIDDSRPVINFDVVVKPDNWDTAMNGVDQPTELRLDQKNFWMQFKSYAADRTPLEIGNPINNWLSVKFNSKLGSKLAYGFATNSKNNTISIKLDFKGNDAGVVKERFDKLFSHYEKESYTQISPNVEWNRNDNQISSNIVLTREFDIKNPNSYNELFEWMLEYSEKFYNFFSLRIQNL